MAYSLHFEVIADELRVELIVGDASTNLTDGVVTVNIISATHIDFPKDSLGNWHYQVEFDILNTLNSPIGLRNFNVMMYDQFGLLIHQPYWGNGRIIKATQRIVTTSSTGVKDTAPTDIVINLKYDNGKVSSFKFSGVAKLINDWTTEKPCSHF